jgi:hypothetical protein
MTDFCLDSPMLDQILRHAELMDRMMDCVGVDAAAAIRIDQGMALYEARTRCIGCCHERQCRDWLARTEVNKSNEAPEFCCNTKFFWTLQRRAQGAQHPSDLFSSVSPSV